MFHGASIISYRTRATRPKVARSSGDKPTAAVIAAVSMAADDEGLTVASWALALIRRMVQKTARKIQPEPFVKPWRKQTIDDPMRAKEK